MIQELEFKLHTKENAPAESKELLNNVEKEFGFAPILFRYTAESPTALKALFTMMDLASQTSFTPAQQQIVALAVSAENNCINCMAGHCYLGKTHEANEQTLEFLFSSVGISIDNPKDNSLAKFAQSVVKNRGKQSIEDTQKFLDAGFTKAQIFEVMVIVGWKTFTNYTNHLTDSPADEEILNSLNN